MVKTLHRQLQRLWWIPLILIAGDWLRSHLISLLILVEWKGQLRWVVPGLILAFGVAFTAVVWRRIGAEFRALAGVLLMLVTAECVLASGILGMVITHRMLLFASSLEWALGWALLGSIGLCIAFGFARRGPERPVLGVTLSAILAVLVGGWPMVGLGPILALLYKDPLPFEAFGGAARPKLAALRAALAGFLTVSLIPGLLLGLWGFRFLVLYSQGEFLWLVIFLLSGAFAWVGMSSKWARSGFVLRMLTLIMGLAFLVIGLLILIFLMNYHGP